MLLPTFMLVLVGCAADQKAPAGEADLQKLLQRLTVKHGICAAAVGVVKDRKLDAVVTANGCIPGSPPPADTVFEAASLSKPVFAYLVLKLVQEGKLALDAPVVNYLPQGYLHQFNPAKPPRASESDWVRDPRLQAVTVRMVLNHTSGLPNWANGPLTFEADPGAKWIYSGEGYMLLQRAVEAVTQQPLDQAIAARVLQPFDMRHSSYRWEPRFERTAARGMADDGTPYKLGRFHFPVAPASLHTTAEDYGRFLAGVLNDQQALDRLLAMPVPVNPGLDVSWGLGWGLEQRSGATSIWQWGNNAGYRAFTMASVGGGNGIVIFTNSDDGMVLAEPITRYVLPGAHRVFRMPVLRNGLAYVLCDAFEVCI